MNRRFAASVLAVSTLAAVGSMAWADPAFASVQKTGNTSCPMGEYVEIVAEYSGVGDFYWPSSVYQATDDHDTTIYSSTEMTGKRNTSWKVVVTGGLLDDDGTYGSCVPMPELP